MAIGILGRKVGMTQLFDEAGQVVPVTVIQAGPCDVLQVRTVERDGYEAIQLGFADKPRRLATRSVRGHVAKLESKRSKKRSSNGVELLPKGPFAGRYPSVQLARSPFPLGARHRLQNTAHSETRRLRALDPLPHRAGLH